MRHEEHSIIIAGPTASGKSALALSLAKKTGRAILNADSMQVYEDLQLLSARPSLQEVSQAPHHLFGCVPSNVNYSVGHYLEDVSKLLKTLKKPPIFVGGTGLYFKALFEGLSKMPDVPENIRQNVREETAVLETPAIHALLDEKAKAHLRPSDRLRCQRALEVFRATGISIVEWYDAPRTVPILSTNSLKFFLHPPREVVMARINLRFEEMMQQGALQEVQNLAQQNLDPMLPVMRAHGVPPLLKSLRGEMPLQDAITKAQQDTRQYAKRQFTWFRNQMQDFIPLNPEKAEESVLAHSF